MRTLSLLTAVAALALATPTSADSLSDAMAAMASMDTCGGSTCTSTTAGTRNEAVYANAGSPSNPDKYVEVGFSDTCVWGNGKPMLRVNPVTCAAESLVGSQGGSALVGNRSINTVTTSTLTVDYDPALGFQDGWSTSLSSTTTDAP